MVDPLSVSSLALQLIGTAREIYGVWKLLRGASAESAIVSDRLELVYAILQELTVVEGNQQNSNSIVLLALERSRKQLEEFRLTVSSLQVPAKGFKRRCSKSMKIIISEEKIGNMRDLLQTLLSDLSLALQVAQRISKAVEASYGILDRMEDIKQSILISRQKDPHSSLRLSSHSGGLIGQPNYHSQPSVAVTRCSRKLHYLEKRSSSTSYKQDSTNRQRRLWMLLWAVIWNYECEKAQKAHQGTLILIHEKFRFSLEPLTSLVPGLVVQMIRDQNVPGIHMRLDWTQLVGRSEFERIVSKGDLFLRQEVESRRLSVNACDESGLSLLGFITDYETSHFRSINCLIESGADTSVTLVLGNDDDFNIFVFTMVRLALSDEAQEDVIFHEMECIIKAHDIDLAVPSHYGANILHDIARYPSSTCRDSFLSMVASYHPDINAKDRNGWTPLLKMMAVDKAWNKEFFTWLLENGADVCDQVCGGPPTRLENGVTCLHLIIAALQPVSLSESRSCFVGLQHLFSIANIPAQSDNLIWGVPKGCRKDRIDQTQRLVQEELLKIMIGRYADLHAVDRYWGTPTDIARYTGNIDFWCNILEYCHINIGGFLAYDSTIPRGVDILVRHEALERSHANRQLVMEKLQGFWRAIECWNTQSTQKSNYAPLTLGHLSALKATQIGLDDLRYFLLRLLSNKRVGQALVPRLLICKSKWWTACGLSAFLGAVELECHTQNEINLMYSVFTPRHAFIKSHCDGSGFKTRLEAFLEFIRMCQAKATGKWTVEQEKARQMDRTRLRYADETLLRILRILTETVARFQWPDEVMGWGEVEDHYPSGNVPGQWVDDEYC